MRSRFFLAALIILVFGASVGSAHSFSFWGEKKKITITPWPPQVGQPYPDLALTDQNGKAFKLSDFKGKVILVEPIGMTCQACQAFSGAHGVGGYGGITAQPGLLSIHALFPQYAGGLQLPRPDVVLVQLLLYDLHLGPPVPADAKNWAEHFGFLADYNEVVAVSSEDLRSDATYKIIPGFQLIDRNFILRSDSTGYTPADDLYTGLLPLVPQLLEE